ncbi:hypothetical protein BN874_1270015 [Candidatus Contendobacter odensis Run_B_J11]|uniref:Uncharacterized protein n=1 Tax=Candidatus Contendobacter odensis Run_B_J11 TaxID=1400861 RepID=A0A7U7J228_9GAMM|nr:hypothetical protein BN874_1270015 [Candidatus Contendobacter odensis Run_B_J11]
MPPLPRRAKPPTIFSSYNPSRLNKRLKAASPLPGFPLVGVLLVAFRFLCGRAGATRC